jgi:hypothetical protein
MFPCVLCGTEISQEPTEACSHCKRDQPELSARWVQYAVRVRAVLRRPRGEHGTEQFQELMIAAHDLISKVFKPATCSYCGTERVVKLLQISREQKAVKEILQCQNPLCQYSEDTPIFTTKEDEPWRTW